MLRRPALFLVCRGEQAAHWFVQKIYMSRDISVTLRLPQALGDSANAPTTRVLVHLIAVVCIGFGGSRALLALCCSLIGAIAGAAHVTSTTAHRRDELERVNVPSAHQHASEMPVPAVPAGNAASAPAPAAPRKVDAGGSEDQLTRLALDTAREAFRLLDEAFASPEACGWVPHSTKSGVSVLTRSSPDGNATWGMGMGEIPAPVGALYLVQEEEATKRVLDKQFDISRKLHEVPSEQLSGAALADGWRTIELLLEQNLYKSPAWPVGPRELCAVRAVVRRQSDGAIRLMYRSADVPGVAPPAGYVRMSLTCGGYEACATTASTPSSPTTFFKYVNMVDPKGSVPSAVVRVTVPDRAMVVARVRKVLASNASIVNRVPAWARD